MCNCDKEHFQKVGFGTFENEENVYYPLEDKFISVDKCLIPELKYLWQRGIETVWCCCGHNIDDGVIFVKKSCIDKMIDLGYNLRPIKTVLGFRKDGFLPKYT